MGKVEPDLGVGYLIHPCKSNSFKLDNIVNLKFGG